MQALDRSFYTTLFFCSSFALFFSLFFSFFVSLLFSRFGFFPFRLIFRYFATLRAHKRRKKPMSNEYTAQIEIRVGFVLGSPLYLLKWWLNMPLFRRNSIWIFRKRKTCVQVTIEIYQKEIKMQTIHSIRSFVYGIWIFFSLQKLSFSHYDDVDFVALPRSYFACGRQRFHSHGKWTKML